MNTLPSTSVSDRQPTVELTKKPKQVQAWLAELPLDNVLASARQLAGYLHGHEAAELAPAFRKQLFDQVMVVARRVLNTLAAEFRNMPLPLDGHRLDHVDHALNLVAAAAAYARRMVLDCAQRSPPLFGENPLPGHLSRFWHLQAEIMDICHFSHRQLPAGYWQTGHQVGLMMFQSGLVGARDPEPPTAILGERYLALLLEASADPYHLTEQERIWALDIIARHGGSAILTPARMAIHGGVFGIRAGEDNPPHPLSWQPDAISQCDLVLNTAPLVRKLALIVSQLDHDQPATKLAPAVRHPAYKELLRRLKLIWGGSSQRTTARHRPVKASQRKVVIGFYPVFHYLSQRREAGDGTAQGLCNLVNESLGGASLQIASPGFQLKIGSLICISRGQADAWSDLGVIRWFKTSPTGALTFGVKYLRGRMAPCLWRIHDGGDFSPGLLAEPDQSAARHIRSLVLPASRLDPEATLDIKQGDRLARLRLEGKTDSQADIDVFRCQTV